MGDVTRFKLDWQWMKKSDNGDYVLYSDYQHLEQRLAALETGLKQVHTAYKVATPRWQIDKMVAELITKTEV